jgi:predicted metal-dependent hydrolase
MTLQLGLFDHTPSHAFEAGAAPLKVRRSRRARRLILRVVPPHTLELVVPLSARAADVGGFVARHRQWIEDTRREIAARVSADGGRLPQRIAFAAVGCSWTVRYRHTPGRRARCRSMEAVLEVHSRDVAPAAVARQLRRWLLAQARVVLVPWLRREAEALGFEPGAVQVRLQRTRWGSCSSSGNISLNAALLFLPAALVRYLFVHELCHLVSLNHSRRFWSTVARFEPDYRVLDRRLSEAWSDVPLWIYEP